MKPQTKRALRRWAICQLIRLVDRAEEWLHEAQVRLRDDLQSLSPQKAETHESTRVKSNPARVTHDAGRVAQFDQQTARSACIAAGDAQRMAENRHHQTYAEWEARRSGVAVNRASGKARTRRATAFRFRKEATL